MVLDLIALTGSIATISRTPQQPTDDIREEHKYKQDEEDNGCQQPEAFGKRLKPHLPLLYFVSMS
jgi:hypothetical protein